MKSFIFFWGFCWKSAQESPQMLFWARKSKEHIQIDLELTWFAHFWISLRGKSFFAKIKIFIFFKISSSSKMALKFFRIHIWVTLKKCKFSKNNFSPKIENIAFNALFWQTLWVWGSFKASFHILMVWKHFSRPQARILRQTRLPSEKWHILRWFYAIFA